MELLGRIGRELLLAFAEAPLMELLGRIGRELLLPLAELVVALLARRWLNVQAARVVGVGLVRFPVGFGAHVSKVTRFPHERGLRHGPTRSCGETCPRRVCSAGRARRRRVTRRSDGRAAWC